MHSNFKVIGIIILALTFNCFKPEKAHACAGAGMVQYFPMAKNAQNQIWVLYLQTVRGDFPDYFEFKSHLILTNAKLEKLDSVYVFEKIIDKSSGLDNMDIAFEADPIQQVDSIYHLGIQKLKSLNLNLTYLTLVGYTLIGENHGPLSFVRTKHIEHYADTSKYKGKETIRRYSDTLMKLTKITFNGKLLKQKLPQTFVEFNEENWIDPLVKPTSSVRLYRGTTDSLIAVLHFNQMSHVAQDTEESWHNLDQKTDVLHGNCLHQPLSWHHNGEDYFVFFER